MTYNAGMSDIVKRKHDHIQAVLDPASQGCADLFANYRLPYRALPEINLSDVSTETGLCGKTLSQPLIIASMTGGSAHSAIINKNLAIAAEETGVAFGVGSQRIALELEAARESFALVRRHAPTAVVFANMGAIQLNNGRTIDDYRRVVDMVKADGLYLHLNPLQEAIQPGGDTNYGGLVDKIAILVEKIDTPVFVKEVGHGLDRGSAEQLVAAGVAGLDIAGVGGTSWAWIESRRAENPRFESWFKSVGWPTDVALASVVPIRGTAKVVASGGIRSPLQGLKARLLGADYYAAAEPFLRPALESATAVTELVRDFQRGLAIGLFSIGAASWNEAAKLQLVGTGETC